MKSIRILILILTIISLSGCRQGDVPRDNVEFTDKLPVINPDYTGLVIPPNIAPMNFEINMPGEKFVTRVSSPSGKSIIAEGNLVMWDMKKWHDLLETSRGEKLKYEVYVADEKGAWKCYSFSNTVANEEIDPYISYRLIEPSYMQYSCMTINQRDLTSFDEDVVFNSMGPCNEQRAFCINCHVPRNQYRDGYSQFHIRRNKAGTVIMNENGVEKVNLKSDSTISPGVYPAWHPTLDLIAYSTNDTHQMFFSFGEQKIEVYDTESDLILYDINTHEVRNIANDSTLLETFPAWHPDGKKLFYSVAAYPEGVTPENLENYYKEIRYDIVSRNFDASTKQFSEPDTVVSASRDGMSVLLPRISPDGKYLLYCKAPYGTFHIWHKNSDLYITDLSTGEERALTNANSRDTDSYHSWSSNSRWIVFSSRRDDGSYTRPYITYIHPDGRDSKAFIVPQETPQYYRELMKSYNVPEFFVSPVEIKRSEILECADKEAIPTEFKSAV